MTQDRKILVISVMQNWGGGEEFLLNLCKNLNGFNFIIASPEGMPSDIFNKNDLITYKINRLKKIYGKKGNWNLFSSLRILLNIIYSTLSLLKLVNKEKPHIVLANGLFAALYGLPLIIFSHKRFFVVQHLIFSESSIEKKIINLVYKYAEKIVCVSKAVHNNVLRMLNKESSAKVIIIPNSIPFPEEYSYNNDSKQINIGIIGSIIRIKGIHLIIGALKSILKNNNVNLYVFGATTEDEDSVHYFSELKKLITDLDLNSKVFFRGYEESKDLIYRSLGIVINYSLIPESFSFTVLETMAFKKIIISADAGGPREIIKDGYNGFLVEPENIKELESKIQFCIDNFYTESFQKIRQNANLSVKNLYSLDSFNENYKNLFRGNI